MDTRGDDHDKGARRDLERLRLIAQLFDRAFGIPGTKWRFGIDALFGLIPVLGDIFDFAFQAQTRNLALLDRWVKTPDRQKRRSRLGVVLIPLAIVLVFATLTALGVWMLFILFHWLASLF